MKLDSKFTGVVVKAKNCTIVPDDQYVVFLAKDNAFAATLPVYYKQCRMLGADERQLASVLRLIERVDAWRAANPDQCKVPDVMRDEKMLDGK